MGSNPTTFSPEEAVQTLRDLAQAETRLTASTVGLSLMLWSLVVPGLFFSIYSIGGGLDSNVPHWFAPCVWLAFVLAGIAATNALWRSRALSAQAGFRPWRIWLQGIAFTVATFAMVTFLADFVFSANFGLTFALATGIVELYLGIRFLRAPWSRRPWALIFATVLIVLSLALLGQLPTDSTPNAAVVTAGAMGSGIALFVPGFLYVRQG